MEYENRSFAQKRFEELASNRGFNNFEIHSKKDKNGFIRYKDGNVQRAFEMYVIGCGDGKVFSGSNFIIGKIVKTDNDKTAVHFSKDPVRHRSKAIAKIEAKRLAEQSPGTAFVIYGSITVVKKNDGEKVKRLSNEEKMNLLDFETPKHFHADDGFGNLIKLTYEQRLMLYFYVFPGEIIK